MFLTIENISIVDRKNTIFEFEETEDITIVIEKTKGDTLNYKYEYIASWIRLRVQSSLDFVGLIVKNFGKLAKHDIS